MALEEAEEDSNQGSPAPPQRRGASPPAARPPPPSRPPGAVAPTPCMHTALNARLLHGDLHFLAITIVLLTIMLAGTKLPAGQRVTLATDWVLSSAGVAALALAPRLYIQPAFRLPYILLMRVSCCCCFRETCWGSM